MNTMTTRYRLIYRGSRGGMFYSVDKSTGKRSSLDTNDKPEALRKVAAMNEAAQQSAMNLSLARIYMRHSDPQVGKRTWQTVLDEIIRTKTGENQRRWETMAKSKWLDPIRNKLLVETEGEHLLRVLQCGKVSVNVYLRRMHNFAIDMNWLPASILPKRQWPAVKYKERRGITLEEHEKIVAAEVNGERKAFYQLCWHLGGSQGDIANLMGEDVDWESGSLSFRRKKTGVPVIVRLGEAAKKILKDLPAEGLLFPYLAMVRPGDRATEFRSRCQQLGIQGVTLHGYRYAWAERAKTAGMPERFAMENLGHNSKAVHRAYAKRALMKLPSLEEYEKQGV
jgi:integrase